jgi:hypothetical protein
MTEPREVYLRACRFIPRDLQEAQGGHDERLKMKNRQSVLETREHVSHSALSVYHLDCDKVTVVA